MPIRFTSRLLDHLSHDGYRPSTIRVIVKDLRIMVEDRDAFDQAIQEAQSEGVIEIGNDQCVRLPSLPDEVTGKYRSNKRGFGFVSPTKRYREGDVYIASGAQGDAVSGDTVRVAVSESSRYTGRGSAGRIIEVITRGRSEYVGSLFKKG